MSGRLPLLAIAFAPALVGCAAAPAVLSGLGAAASVYSALDKFTEATAPYIARACAEYDKGKAAADARVAAGIVAPATADKVATIKSFGDAACATPPTGDPLSTAIWLGHLAGQLAALTAPPQ